MFFSQRPVKPMSEYEDALNSMVRVLLEAVIDAGASRTALAKELRALRDTAQTQGHLDAAATIEMTMRGVGLR